MDVIYSCALMPFMPLVPDVGNDAWAGLPGARPDTRSSIPHKENINDLTLATAQRSLRACLACSAWQTRA